jgi:2-methylcitrate dehydratase PrpD
VALEHFENDAWRDPAVRPLLARVRAAPYTGTAFADDDPFDAEVRVVMKDGRTWSEKVDRPLGRTSDNPIPPAHLKSKFEDCASRVLAPQAAAAAYRRIEAFENVGSIRDFTRLLEPATGGAQSARQAVTGGVA